MWVGDDAMWVGDDDRWDQDPASADSSGPDTR